MTKKIYIVVETTQDYKGAYTTIWGAKTKKKDAQKLLRETIIEVNGCDFEDEKKELLAKIKGDVWTRNDDTLFQRISIVDCDLD